MKKVPNKFHQSNKFSFSIEFQLEVLRYLIQNKEAPLVLGKVKPGYFALIEHALILEGINKFFRKYKKIPSKPLLIETIKTLLESKAYVDLVTKEDIPAIHKILDNLYGIPLKDDEAIVEKIYRFAAYVEMKALTEQTDFSNFDTYEDYQNKVTKIIRDSKPVQEEAPMMMVRDTTRRQLMRSTDPDIVPTPYWQLNNLSNGQGYTKGSIFVILDRPKAKKTFTLINISRGYLTMNKNVLYIDTENGKKQIMERMIQSTLNKTRMDLISGDFDKLEQRHMRKYKRLGVEFIVERVPAMIADTNNIKAIIQRVEAEIGGKINVLVVDYAAKLGSTLKQKEDVERINQVYIDLDNLGTEMGLDAIWTAQHVTREGAKHKATVYEDNDIASAISIIRNAQCILGLNSTDEEEEHNIQRMEVVVQRDGKPHGRCLFNIDADRQRWKEFTREARATYDETQGKVVDKMIKKGRGGNSRNPDADPEKANHKTGDI